MGGARRRLGALPAGEGSGEGRAAHPGLHSLRREASFRPRTSIRPCAGRPFGQPGAADQDGVGRQEPLQGLQAARLRRRCWPLLPQDAGGGEDCPREPEEGLSRLRRQGLRAGRLRLVSRMERWLRTSEGRTGIRAESGEPDQGRPQGSEGPEFAGRHRRTDRPLGESARRVGNSTEGTGCGRGAKGVRGQRPLRRDA